MHHIFFCGVGWHRSHPVGMEIHSSPCHQCHHHRPSACHHLDVFLLSRCEDDRQVERLHNPVERIVFLEDYSIDCGKSSWTNKHTRTSQGVMFEHCSTALTCAAFSWFSCTKKVQAGATARSQRGATVNEQIFGHGIIEHIRGHRTFDCQCIFCFHL